MSVPVLFLGGAGRGVGEGVWGNQDLVEIFAHKRWSLITISPIMMLFGRIYIIEEKNIQIISIFYLIYAAEWIREDVSKNIERVQNRPDPILIMFTSLWLGIKCLMLCTTNPLKVSRDPNFAVNPTFPHPPFIWPGQSRAPNDALLHHRYIDLGQNQILFSGICWWISQAKSGIQNRDIACVGD